MGENPHNRWSNKRLKDNGYQSYGVIPVADREKVSEFVTQKIADGYHVVLKREDRGQWRRLYMKKI